MFDTITRADGSVVRVTPDMRVSREDAQRDLDRRLSSEFTPSIVKAVGQDIYAGLNPSQQAVLNSLAYNYGAHAWNKGLAPVLAALTSGGDVAAAIRGLGSHNDGVNMKRRNGEADLWGAGGPRVSQTNADAPARKPAGRNVAGAATGPWSTFRSIIQ